MDREKRRESLKRRYGNRASSAGMGGPGGGRPGGHGPGGPGVGPGRQRVRMGGKPKDSAQTIRRLMQYINEDKAKIAVAFICILLNTGATLAGSYMLRPIINIYIAPTDGSRGNAAGLFFSLVVLAMIYFTGVCANYLQAKVMLTVAQNALVKLRNDLFTKMQSLPLRYYDTNSNGDLMSRFTNDVDTIGNMLSSTLVQLFSGVLSLVGTLVLMIYTNIYLTVITLIMIPLMMRAGGAVARRSQKYFSAQQYSLGALNGYIEETITGQKVVKVFCHEEVAEEEFSILNQELRDNQIRAQFFGGIMGPVMGNLSQVNYSLTACIGGLHVLSPC